MNRYRFSFVMGAMTALLALSCAKETLFEERSVGSDALCFRVSTESWGDTLGLFAGPWQRSAQDPLQMAVFSGASLPLQRSLATEGDGPETRGYPRPVDNESGDGAFRVACYVNNVTVSGDSFHPDNCRLYFDREIGNYVMDGNGGKWYATGGADNIWMPAFNMRFCAWWPIGSSAGSDPQGNYPFDANTKKLSFQLDKPYAGEMELDPVGGYYAAEEQRELLISVMDYGSTVSGGMPLTFNHALTAVQFSFSAGIAALQGATVKRITIKNVAYKGELNLMNAASDLSGAWTVAENSAADLADFTVLPSTADLTYAGNRVLLNDAVKTFFMLPQSLVDQVGDHRKEVEIECEKDGETMFYLVGLYLEDTNGDPIPWLPGQLVQYILTL